LLFTIISTCWATIGVDFSGGGCDGSDSGDYTCLHSSGYDFAIIQTWQGGYGYTSHIADCVSWAWDAKFAHVDVYIFFCPQCSGNGDAASVVSTVFNNLKNSKVNYGMIWFDIEECSGCWSSSSDNVNYIAAGVNEAVKLGAHAGIYSSVYEWGKVCGGSTAFKDYPIWYANWDDAQSFSDWSDFGGWTKPAMKQYTDHGACIDVDSDWYPSESFEKWRAEILATNQTLIPIPVPEDTFPKELPHFGTPTKRVRHNH